MTERKPGSRFRAVGALLSLGVLVACNSDFFADPKPLEGLISLTQGGNTTATLPADGFSRVTLLATIDPATPEARRMIVFTTTHGLFFTGATQSDKGAGQVAEIVADAKGEARVDLQSVQMVADGRVTATVKAVPSVTTTIPVSLKPVVADDVIKFTAASLSLGGDGFSTKFLSVKVAEGMPAAMRTVHFEATAGSFIGGTTVATGGVHIVPDASNIATIQYRSPAQSGSALIRARAAGVTRELPVTLLTVPGDSILRLVAFPTTIDADGTSITTAGIWVAPRVPAESRVVRLSITTGTLIANPLAPPKDGATIDLPVGQDDSAHVDIRSPMTPGTARLRGTVGAFTQETLISFRAALPDTILLSADRFVMKPADTPTVTAKLVRAVGVTSRNTFVTFWATDSTGATVGQFRDQAPSNDAGVATAVFGAPEVTSRTTVYLHASLLNGARHTLFKLVVAP